MASLFTVVMALAACAVCVGADTYQVGNFSVVWDGSAVTVLRSGFAESVWQTVASPFLGASLVALGVEEDEGMFLIHDTVICASAQQVVQSVNATTTAVNFIGILQFSTPCPIAMATFSFSVHVCDPTLENQLCLTYSASTAPLPVNASLSLQVKFATSPDEQIFGFGVQYSVWNMKGRKVPILVSEQGVGRGLQPVTAVIDALNHGGGSWKTTYAPVAHFITSNNNSFALENTEYSSFDLTASDRCIVEVFSASWKGRIFAAQSPLDAVGEYTKFSGRMKPLPTWAMSGAIVGYQGGTAAVLALHARMVQAGVPVAGYWLQDWTGIRRLWWNWELDTQYYFNWTGLCAELAADGARVLTYINPYLADTVSRDKPYFRRDLFKEAAAAGYLIKPYILASASPDFTFGTVDTSNPAARAWYAQVIQQNMIGTGQSGWMADFGEYLPFDATLAVGSGSELHNQFPTDWATINEAATESSPEKENVYFMRSAFTHSPAHTSLFWLGDQLVTWDAFDGLQSALIGMLTSGLSGFGFSHSDIGGYTMINNHGLKYLRDEELLLRWMELSAVSDAIFRSHLGNLPNQSAQVFSTNNTLSCFGRMATLHTALSPLRTRLMSDHLTLGYPLVRPLWLHYPQDQEAIECVDAFLLGSDVFMAPVMIPNATSRTFYLPAGTWVHLWTQKQYASTGLQVTIAADMGSPPLFYRLGSPVGLELVQAMSAIDRFPCSYPE